tara:strand:+ start:351 stop:698 length:348 start_codon:yes stop_codon:yes gene_type:complete
MSHIKNNTYFASATWYDDDDSKPRPPVRQYFPAQRIPRGNNSNTYYTDVGGIGGMSYLIKDSDRVSQIEKHNKSIINEDLKEMEREYEELREKAKEANLIWLSKQREAVKKAKEV